MAMSEISDQQSKKNESTFKAKWQYLLEVSNRQEEKITHFVVGQKSTSLVRKSVFTGPYITHGYQIPANTKVNCHV